MNENTNQKSRADRLVLIDGSAILHRAYHALPPLTSPEGKLVNAVYGVTSMIFKIFHDFQPTHMAVAFDRPAPTFRQELFKEYQAQRPPMENELVSQIRLVHEVIQSLGIPIYEVDGFEADDVLGSIAKQVQSAKFKMQNEKPDEITIVTGDRDLLQLVDDESGIRVFMPVKGLSEGKLFGEAEAKEKFEVHPKQIPDFKAIAGDASDNYPGVTGIGPKTAAQLLKKFGSLERLLAAIRERKKVFKQLPEGLQDKLTSGVKNALLSKQLATIRTDAPINASLDAMKVSTLATPASRMKLAELGFTSLLKRLVGHVGKKLTAKVKEEKKSEYTTEQQKLL